MTSGIDPLFTGMAKLVLHGANVVTRYFVGKGTSPRIKNGKENINHAKIKTLTYSHDANFECDVITVVCFAFPIALHTL